MRQLFLLVARREGRRRNRQPTEAPSMLLRWHSARTARLQKCSNRHLEAAFCGYNLRVFLLWENRVDRVHADRQCSRIRELCQPQARPTSSLPVIARITAIPRCGIWLVRPEIRNLGLEPWLGRHY